MRNLLGVFAEMEREMIAERTREKMEAFRRKGLFISGIPPMGYVRGKDKLLQIEPKGAALIKRIFRDHASHGTTYSIADALNGEGISRSMRNGNKRLWTPMDIQRTLRNALYAGYIASGEELFEGQHKALISRAEWERVQTKL